MSKPLLFTNRAEVDGDLEVFAGKVPADLKGHFYVCYPVGSVNSDGLPFPNRLPNGKPNPEAATPIMNGDGMAVKIRFAPGETPTIRSRVLKPPCYYADLNTRYGTELHPVLGFKNFGISRMSLGLGARNEVNTALIPVQFKNLEHPFLLATYDVGRPFITDPDTLKLRSPVGWNREWVQGTPAFLPWPLTLVQTTAHPTFDPVTKELFSVNFTRSSSAMIFEQRLQHFLKTEPDHLENKMEELARQVSGEEGEMFINANTRIESFFKNLPQELDRPDPVGDRREIRKKPKGQVVLVRWTGEDSLERWILQDQEGKEIVIEESMHQTGITKDYFIITECSFKFSIDLLINNPFPHNDLIDRMIRAFLARPMEPFTNVYLVRRADLPEGGGVARCTKLKSPIPLETIHYSCNFANPDDKITLYGVHNAAVCIAEWVRRYDIDQLTGAPTDPELHSLFAVGSMDVSRFGKWVIDAGKGAIVEEESKVYLEEGDWRSDHVGPNTWGIGLYGYRGMISCSEPVDEIRYLWYISDGVDTRMLTRFIHGLYEHYQNRKVPVEQILKVTERGVPFSMTRLNTATMEAEDYYQAAHNTFIRSVEFIPRTAPRPGVDPQLDGYLVTVVQAGYEQPDGSWQYGSEFWIFEAEDISRGPVCKMRHPDLQFAFTLHTTWLPEARTYNGDYFIDIRKDYNETIDRLGDKALLRPFFEKYVYPYFLSDSPPPPAPIVDPMGRKEDIFAKLLQFLKIGWRAFKSLFKRRKRR